MICILDIENMRRCKDMVNQSCATSSLQRSLLAGTFLLCITCHDLEMAVVTNLLSDPKTWIVPHKTPLLSSALAV